MAIRNNLNPRQMDLQPEMRDILMRNGMQAHIIANGDGEQWRKEGKREWDKYTFGIYGCWVMDDDGNLDYVPEEEYTEELWNEQKKAAGRHVSAVARK